MNKRLFPKIGTCDNCKEKKVELFQVKINGKIKEFCDTCRQGYYLEKNEQRKRT